MSKVIDPDAETGNPEHYAMWPWGLSFRMVKATGAELVWSNSRLPYEGGDEAVLDEFAWNIPIDKSEATSGAPTRTFYAECYGGSGIHHNGGGVRCAWKGKWIAKGIGINLLSGYSDEDAAEYRNNGRANLAEMYVEAIWGEVLHYALPYGAVRMTAVIRTGETLADPLNRTGGIGVREFVWRPAHFMRTHLFHIRPENRPLIPSDTVRVKAAIARLPHMLPMPASLSEQELARLTPLTRLKAGLDEMVRRFAEQLAAAQSKRLSHGTLSPSNISLDGRWNDLNSVSALPGYGYRRNMTPVWGEHAALNSRIIELLCFYIGKYFPAVSGEPFDAMPTSRWLSSLHSRYYNDALARYFVALCGYPQIVANQVWESREGQYAMRALSTRLIELARSGHSPRRPYDDDMRNNTVKADYDLAEILKEFARAGLPGQGAPSLQTLIGDAALRHDFSQRYSDVRNMMFAAAETQGVPARNFSRLVAFNCYKSGRNVSFLFRNVIFEECRVLAEDRQELVELRRAAGRLITRVIDEARVVYQERVDFTVLLWCKDEMTLEYDARADCLVVDIAGHRSELSCGPCRGSVSPVPGVTSLLASMYDYWGKDYEEIMR